MKEHQIQAIKDMVNYIEDGLKDSINLDELSLGVGLSKFHLHRLFKSITGKSVMTYVRGRKLSSSLWELINTKLNVLDIANEYHFEHEQSYIRAFKQHFMKTPSQYRREHCEVPIEQKIDTNQLINIGQGLLIQPRMCIRKQFYIQGIKDEIIHEENLKMKTANQLVYKFQNEYLPKITNAVDKNCYIGFVLYSDNPLYSNYYISSVEIASLLHCEEPFVTYTVPMQEYAVFRYIGFHHVLEIAYESLLELYDYIDRWVYETSYRQAAPYHFERVNLLNCSEEYCEMDIYVPIGVR